MRFEKLIAGADFVRVVVGVREARAADFLHAHAQAQAAPALRELRLDLFRRTFSQLYRHRLVPQTAIAVSPFNRFTSRLDRLQETFHVRGRIRRAQAQAHRAARELGLDAHRDQRRRRLGARARARRARRHRIAELVELDHERLAVDARKREIRRVRNARRALAENHRAELVQSRFELARAARRGARRAPIRRDRGQLRRRAEADDRRHVLGARAHALLVAAARDDRLQLDALVDDQRAHAFRAVDLVRRDAHRVHVERAEIDFDLAQRLHGVGVHPRAAPLAPARRPPRRPGSRRSRCSRA